MKAYEFRNELFESLAHGTDARTLRHLTEMRDQFLKPYGIWLGKKVNESQLHEESIIDPETWQLMMADVELLKQGKPIAGASLNDIVPPNLQQNYYARIPDANKSTPVKGYAEKIKTAISNVTDGTAKKELLKLAQTAVKNPNLQSLALTAIAGAAGAATLLATANPQAAGAVAGGLASIARAKMAGQDWKSAAKAGIEGAAMGLAAGTIGGLAATAVGQLGHMMMTNTSVQAPIADASHHKSIEDDLTALKQMARDGKITDHASYEKALDSIVATHKGEHKNMDFEYQQARKDELDLMAGAQAADAHGGKMSGGSAAIEQAFVELENPAAAKGFNKDVAQADTMRKAMGNAASGKYTPTYNDNGEYEESIALAASLHMLSEADNLDRNPSNLYKKMVADKISQDDIKAIFKKYQMQIPADVAATASDDASTAKPTVNQSITTGDAEIDKLINDKLSKEGKDAAVALAKELLYQEQQASLKTLRGIKVEIARLSQADARAILNNLQRQGIQEADASASQVQQTPVAAAGTARTHPDMAQQLTLAISRIRNQDQLQALLRDLRTVGNVAATKPAVKPAVKSAAKAKPVPAAAPAQPAAAPAPVPTNPPAAGSQLEGRRRAPR